MIQYILKRILIFIPTLIAISLLTFIISINAPGDPVEMMLEGDPGGDAQIADRLANEMAYIDQREELGLDLPIFYVSFTNSAIPDTLFKIPNFRHRAALKRLIHNFGNWGEIVKFYDLNRELDLASYRIQRDSLNAPALITIRELTDELLQTHSERRIQFIFSSLENLYLSTPSLNVLMNDLDASRQQYEHIKATATIHKRYIPTIHFYGTQNQYHQWAINFIRGDFGISYQDKRPVSSVIWDAIQWTFLISIIAMFITYLVAVPIGVRSAIKKGTNEDKIVTTSLFILYSLPNFWVATLLIMFFSNPEYLEWFPTYGVGSLPDYAPFVNRFFDTAYHLILPLICWTYSSFAFLSRQMRGGMLNVIRQDFIRTARAKGLNEKKVIWKHAFKNSLLPIITLFANVFPMAIGGSIVLETIFTIPGMGKLGFEAVISRNYPIVFTVMMFSAILTLIGYLVADILYAVVDPRISYSEKK